MINLNVEGISFHMQLKVESDGTLTMLFADGSVSLTADGVPEMTTIKHFNLNEQLLEEFLGAPLAKMIRDAVHATIAPAEGEERKADIINLLKSDDPGISDIAYDANTAG